MGLGLLRNVFFKRGLSSSGILNSSNALFTKEDHRAFMAEFPNLVRELTFDEPILKGLPIEINKHLSKCLQYNAPGGKKTRGLAVLSTYKNIFPEIQSDATPKEAIVLGWCVELLQAYFLVMDDIMDGSPTRRQQPAWHAKEEVGLLAINDGIFLESCVYQLLKIHFKDKPYYQDCVNLFLKINRYTIVGQTLDMTTSSNGSSSPNLDLFDMNRYSSIVKYKTSFYSFYLPVALGMKLCGVYDKELYRQARTILLEIGHYFQVQDDYMDCFGDPKVTGKVGTDIQDAKCSWLIVVALQRANSAQKQILRSSYGSSDEEKINMVKSVYKELKIPKIYANYEENTYKAIETNINQLSGGAQGIKLPPQLFKGFLNRIHLRNN